MPKALVSLRNAKSEEQARVSGGRLFRWGAYSAPPDPLAGFKEPYV